MTDQVTVAGVDCGTNSIRLLIARVDEQGLHLLAPRSMEVIRLGEGVDRNHRFADQALERAYRACRLFADQLDSYKVDGIRFVATSATRDAANRNDFEEGVQSILGVRPEVISGTEEAELSFLGAISVLESAPRTTTTPKAPYMVVDLGGGSTELVVGGDGNQSPVDRAGSSYSMNIGSVRITERHLLADPPTQDQIDQAVEDVDRHIDRAFETVPVAEVGTLVGVSGTVTTMSALALGCTEYDSRRVDGVAVPVSQARQTNQEVLHMSRQERRGLSPIHPGRIDVIGGGALIWDRLLERISQACPAVQAGGAYIASEHGLLDGLVLDYGRSLLHS
ncbi:Ppx/GppA phosphatase family protein [Bifidobacterium coryneforme]|uniref:Ppx/GppA phosphatase family protein n=1 Tax=Bifidobacterium coryneforme TaxID=1687 RepID=UPI0004E5CF4B|nr:Ppx/GppA phosphatase family protein [Bifidobacterium coryneforme]AII74829.1 Ppx/GppA phosphatase family protein [Bifidobacterium coryneforme]